MIILCVGDVVGGAGCQHLRRVLPVVKRQYGVDICIVNGENAADGNGITPAAAAHILDSGADVITGGNHTDGGNSTKCWTRRPIYCGRPIIPRARRAGGCM